MEKCRVCGKDGQFAQVPYSLPFSDCYCDICYELEGIAFNVWQEQFPEKSKFLAPFPFLNSMDDIPPDCLNLNLEQVKSFYRKMLNERTNDVEVP